MTFLAALWRRGAVLCTDTESRSKAWKPTEVQGAATGTSLNFEVSIHDNMFHIVEAVRSKRLVDHDKSAALAIGLKLLSEVALEKRQDPLFAPPHNSLRRFIPQLKAIKLPAYSDTR